MGLAALFILRNFNFRYNNRGNADIFGTANRGMLRRRLALAAGAVLLLLIVGDMASSVYFPKHICSEQKKDPSSPQERCGIAESITYRSLEWTLDWIDRRHDFIIAPSTFFIGIFTWTIWLTSRNQLNHARQVERAYISGGVKIIETYPQQALPYSVDIVERC